jgi:hypothetical protein
VEDGKEVPAKQEFSESTTIGVDFGITDFALFQLTKRLKILSTEKLFRYMIFNTNSLLNLSARTKQ